MLCQPGVEHLLHGPACFTKLTQAHHARAALERVKSTAQCSLLAQVSRVFVQPVQSFQTRGNNFLGFLNEDAQQFLIRVILRQLKGWSDHRNRRWCSNGFWCRLWHQLDGLCNRLAAGEKIDKRIQRFGFVLWRMEVPHIKTSGLSGQKASDLCGLKRHHFSGFVVVALIFLGHQIGRGKIIELSRYRCGYRVIAGFWRNLNFSRSWCCACRHWLGLLALAAHDDAQLIDLSIVDKKLARHIALIAEHVHQKAHCAHAVAQLQEQGLLVNRSNLPQHETLNVVSHALHGQGSLVHAKNRQNATHLRHLVSDRCQSCGILRITEKLIQLGLYRAHAIV